MTAIPLRLRKRANVFAPSDVAELRRWAMEAPRADLYLQRDHDAGEEPWIGRADFGDEFVSIARGSPDAPSVARITPEQGRWVLREHRHVPIGHFASLNAVLEQVSEMFGVEKLHLHEAAASKRSMLKLPNAGAARPQTARKRGIGTRQRLRRRGCTSSNAAQRLSDRK